MEPKNTPDNPRTTILEAPEPDTYPDGGARAWLVVLGAWCAMIPSMGLLNTIGVLQAWLSEEALHGYSESSIAWILSTYAFCLYFGGAQVGPVFDAREIRWLVVPGGVGIVASCLCVSFSTEYYQFLLSFGVLGGLSSCLLFTPAVSCIGHWFSTKRALAIGIACTAGGIGGVAFPLMILFLAPKIGFPWTMRIIGLVNMVMCIAACVLLRKRLPDNKKAGASIDLKALRDTNYALTTLAVWLIEFAVFVPYTYISSYAIYMGMSTHDAYLLNALLNAGAIPGRALPGYVADRYGAFNTMLITSFICACLIFALWLTAGSSKAAITSFTVVFGFWSGTGISLTPVCVASVCKMEDYGKRNGTTFSLCSFAVLIGLPIAGAILQTNEGYTELIVFAGAMYVAAFLAFLATRVVAGGWSPKILF
ncbi:hypothetical protein ACN47E_008527 [Coniothyrium glycines]